MFKIVNGKKVSLSAQEIADLELRWAEAEVLAVEESKQELRRERDKLLKDTDWVVIQSVEKGNPLKKEWKDYRQALRDLPQQVGFPESIIWPTKPE